MGFERSDFTKVISIPNTLGRALLKGKLVAHNEGEENGDVGLDLNVTLLNGTQYANVFQFDEKIDVCELFQKLSLEEDLTIVETSDDLLTLKVNFLSLDLRKIVKADLESVASLLLARVDELSTQVKEMSRSSASQVLLQETPESSYNFVGNNQWQPINDLCGSISVASKQLVQVHYSITCAGQNRHLVTRLMVDDVEVKQARRITGNTAYINNTAVVVVSLGKGDHKVSVEYRCPHLLRNNPSDDWEHRSLTVVAI